MDYNIKKLFVYAVMLLCAVACQQRYEVDLPLSLNREEMRFLRGGDSYYVLVYCRGDWTAALEHEAPWLSFSRLFGKGNLQIMVTAEPNAGVSRGVTLTVSGDGDSRELYISQECGLPSGESGHYALEVQQIDLGTAASSVSVGVSTNLDDQTLSGWQGEITYSTESENWIHDLSVTSAQFSFSFDANGSGNPRSAQILLTFPLARWDKPVTCVLTINQ